MSLQILFRPEARSELVDAWSWYEERRPGLGAEMVACVDAAAGLAARAPLTYPVIDEPVRRILVRRFPYGIFYVVEDECLVVLAVAHVRRQPGYWRERLATD